MPRANPLANGFSVATYCWIGEKMHRKTIEAAQNHTNVSNQRFLSNRAKILLRYSKYIHWVRALSSHRLNC